MTDGTNELTPEETTDPVLDMTLMQNRIDEMQEAADEAEYYISALNDSHRVSLTHRLLPVFIAEGMGVDSAIKKARTIADRCVTVMAEDMNKKATAYRKLIEKQRADENEKRALITMVDDDENAEN